jgi:cystathionine gamma-synthase
MTDPPTSRPPETTWHTETLAVTLGRPRRVADAPLNEPLTMASTYVVGGGTEYGRYGNPTWTAFEETLGALEGGRCLSFASGMAAICTVLDLLPLGARVVAPAHSYTGTLVRLRELVAQGRLALETVDITDTASVVATSVGADLVWFESPTNPAMEVADIAAIAAGAHEHGAIVVVDNTFATPLHQQPLRLGADLVVHSATKYLAGHSDVLMGAVITTDERLFGDLLARRSLQGNIPGAAEAWLALRGMRTLSVRLERAQSSATTLAGRLADHPAVSEVRYPGHGGMISIVLHGDAAAADRVCRATHLWVDATSLGGVESTLERRRRWASEAPTIPESLIRLSVGLEHVDDLYDDLAAALDLVR